MERRAYGSTGLQLSIIGLGGMTLGQMPQREVTKLVRESMTRGLNYFDMAPTYADAETKLGLSLGKSRSSVFVGSKTDKRTATEASDELHASLRAMRTDYIDVYQLHALTSIEDVESCFSSNGAMRALVGARDKGLIRFLGFSAHSVEAALSAIDHFPFDSVMFPFNYSAYTSTGFGIQVLASALKHNMSCIAIKAMARGRWPDNVQKTHPNCWYEPFTDPRTADLALRWSLSLPITSAIPPGDPFLFRFAIDVAERFALLSEDERKDLESRTNGSTPLFPL